MVCKILKIFVILFFGFLCFPISSNAVEYYTENFNSVDNSKWNYYCNYYSSNPIFKFCNSTEIDSYYRDGSILLSSTTPYFPVVLSKNVIFPKNENFSIRIKFRFPIVTNRGVGLGIGYTGLLGNLYSQFGIWNDSSSYDNFKFYYNDFNESACSNFNPSISDTAGRQTINNIVLKDSFWHYLTINRIGEKYYVYLDRLVNEDTPVFTTTIRNNCVPDIIWFGNFISDSGGAWTTFSLDDIVVSSEPLFPFITQSPTQTPTVIPTQTPTNTPTPTPEPTSTPVPTNTSTPVPTATLTPTLTPTPTSVPKSKKIFILPGLGASWNSKAMLFNGQAEDKEWKMTPHVNNYDALIQLLNNNGLEKDVDYFVWNYDWRKRLDEIETKFNQFVESKNLDDDEIYLIGHSLGGLVARLWASDNLNNYDIKEVITLGSPHMGSLDTYSVWNGSEVLSNKGISSVAFKILLGLQNKSFVIKDLTKVRNFAPIMEDLLPVFDYATKDDKLISWKNLESKNNNLYLKNQNKSILGSKLNLFVGVGYSTPSVFKLGKRSVYDKALGLWPDGRILDFSSSNGDGTVLKNSAGLDFQNFSELNSDHGAIVNKSLGNIAQKLNLNNRNFSYNNKDNFSDSLIVYIGSPTTGKLICNKNIFEETEGFILVPNNGFNKCELVLSPTDNGTVHLIFGNTKNNNWTYLEKDVELNKPEKVEISFAQGRIISSKNNKNFLNLVIKKGLQQLGLNKAIPYLNKNDFKTVTAYVSEYRDIHNEWIISQRILDNLLIISTINNYDKRKFDIRLIEKNIDIIDKIITIQTRNNPLLTSNAFAYEVLQNFKKEVELLIKEKTYPDFATANALLAGYSKDVLGY